MKRMAAPAIVILLLLLATVVRADTPNRTMYWVGGSGSFTGLGGGGRDPLHQPFSRDSIWNLPLGASASYVWAGIRHATDMAYFTDADVLILKPSAPATTVYTNYDDWGAGTRCATQGPALFTVPIPSDFIVPGSHQGSPDGDTPNRATAILAADGRTLIQTQPFARCSAVQAPTSHYVFGNEDLYGTGVTGSHGGSGLSALGGTVRIGELVPGGTIPHALKLNMDATNFYPGLGGFRWPAWKSDAGGAGYTGSIPAVRMGSLLALRSNFSIASLQTEPGKIIARAFAHYGGYIVDSAGWSVNNFVTERSPDGAVQDEFQSAWGYPLNTAVGANGWAADLDSIFTNLWAVDSWDHATWQTVSASAGSLGVGLGTPLVSWAAPTSGQTVPTGYHWSFVSGGTALAMKPGAGTPIVFDAASGTGTATVLSDITTGPVTITPDSGMKIAVSGGKWTVVTASVSVALGTILNESFFNQVWLFAFAAACAVFLMLAVKIKARREAV